MGSGGGMLGGRDWHRAGAAGRVMLECIMGGAARKSKNRRAGSQVEAEEEWDELFEDLETGRAPHRPGTLMRVLWPVLQEDMRRIASKAIRPGAGAGVDGGRLPGLRPSRSASPSCLRSRLGC